MAAITSTAQAPSGDLALNPTLTAPETHGVSPTSSSAEPDLSLAGLVASGHASAEELEALSPEEKAVAESPKLAPAKKNGKAATRAAEKPAEPAKVEAAAPVVAATAVVDAAAPAVVVEAVTEVAAEVAEVVEAADPAAAETPKKEEEKLGTLAVQLRNRERGLVQKQQLLTKERTEFEASKAATERNLTDFRQRVEAYKGQLEQHAKAVVDESNSIIALAQQSPIAFLKKLGWTEEQISVRALNGDKPAADESTTRMERHLAALQQELAAERAERLKESKARQDAEAKAEETRSHAAILADFISTARSDAARWPLASAVSDARLKREGDRIAEEKFNDNPNTTWADILDAMEDDLGEIATAALKGKSNGKSPSAAAAKSTPSAKNAASPQAPPGTARNSPSPTLTASAASERAVDLDAEVDVLNLSQEDLMARTMAEVDRIVQNGQQKTIGRARAQG